MTSHSQLCYSIIRKRDKILEYKNKLSRAYKRMIIGCLGLGVLFLPLSINSRYFSFEMRTIDILILVLAACLGSSLYLIWGNYKRVLSKYELLRHDMMKDLEYGPAAPKICYCQNACNCREEFIKQMDQLGVDLIFKKYITEKKYPV